MRPIITFLFVTILLSSCVTVKKYSPDQVMTKADLHKDVEFVKAKLIEKHYDLNWENRQNEILDQLDQIVEQNETMSIHDFRTQLESVVNTVDDGHTRILGVKMGDESKFQLDTSFLLEEWDDKTIYFKVPTFLNQSLLLRYVNEFGDFYKHKKADRVILDLRGNHGGFSRWVEHFLTKTLENKTQYCVQQSIKKPKGILYHINHFLFRAINGYKLKGDYIVKKCNTIESNLRFNPTRKYVIVDSTIVSGAMIAVYHLKKDGYTVIGSAPKSLFNSFGNAYAQRLPQSNLYIAISSLRIVLDENVNDRYQDMLIPDYVREDISLDELRLFLKDLEGSDSEED